MSRHIFIFAFSLVLIFCFSVGSFGVNYTPYSSVSASTSNISMLIETMLNQSDFNVFQDWIGIRTGQYDFSVFYNIADGSCVRLRYYGVSNGYNVDYYFSKTVESNFSYYRGNYTIVGNTEDSLASSSYRSAFYQQIVVYTVPFILVVLLFFVFRIRKRQGGITV